MPVLKVETTPEFVNPTPEELAVSWERQELLEFEKSKPYAKYYYRDPAPPEQSNLKAMEHPIDPAHALYPEDINRLLDPGYMECETGWCQLPNGCGYIANLLQMPGVTADMIYWWFRWFPIEHLRYKIWYKPNHVGHYVSPATRARILDPKVIRNQDAVWGQTHHALEDTGSGPELIHIHFLSPEDMGFDMDRFKQPYVSAMVGGNGDEEMLMQTNAPAGGALMCHIIRDVPGGVEWRTRFWFGYVVRNKKFDRFLPPGEVIPVSVVQGLALHNVREFSNLRVLLPEIYKEYGHLPIFED